MQINMFMSLNKKKINKIPSKIHKLLKKKVLVILMKEINLHL